MLYGLFYRWQGAKDLTASLAIFTRHVRMIWGIFLFAAGKFLTHGGGQLRSTLRNRTTVRESSGEPLIERPL
jgi:hypothetical protein